VSHEGRAHADVGNSILKGSLLLPKPVLAGIPRCQDHRGQDSAANENTTRDQHVCHVTLAAERSRSPSGGERCQFHLHAARRFGATCCYAIPSHAVRWMVST
jgi:hypothetical protein